MVNRGSSSLAVLRLAAAGFWLSLFPAPAQWADRNEYDLALALRQQADPAMQMKLIAEWKRKYPSSAYAAQRAELHLAAALSVGDTNALEEAVADLNAAAPDSLVSLYWTTVLAPSAKDQSESALQRYEYSATRLLEAMQSRLAENARGEDARELPRVQSLAYRTLGWVQWKQQQLDQARASLLKALEFDPGRADVSAWLGVIASSDPAPEAQIEAIFRLARAVYLDGPGALPSSQRRDVRALLESVYTFYHGSPEGLDAVAAVARDKLHPPQGFRIESAAEIVERLWEKQVLEQNPDLAPFLELRRSLIATADADLLERLQAAPPLKLRATVLGCGEPGGDSGIHLAITDQHTFEAILRPDPPVSRCPPVGSVLEFTARVTAFQKSAPQFTLAVPRKAITTVSAASPSRQP
jgi:tetratricopeptide (TPR) repeat protein